MLKKILPLIFSLLLFAGIVLLFLNIKLDAPTPTSPENAPEFINSAKKYIVPFDVSFGAVEKKIDPKNYPSDFMLVAPRGDLISRVLSTKDFDFNGKKYTDYTESLEYAPNKEILYTTNYLVELPLRRIDKIAPLKNSKVALVFIGCSNTFGEGVDYEKTLPGIFAKKYPQYDVYNLSGRGSSLALHLFHLKQGTHFLNNLTNSSLILIYTYVEDHIFRESCSSLCLKDENSWRLGFPRFDVTGQGLAYAGTHRDAYFNNPILKYVFLSNLMKERHVPPLYSEENFLRHELILNEIYNEVSRRKTILKAYHYFGYYNSVENINTVLPYIEKTKYKPIILNYYNQALRAGLNPYLIKFDSHPSALGYEVSFNTLHSVLKSDFPDLF